MRATNLQLGTDGIADPVAREFLANYVAAWASPTPERLAGFWAQDGELLQVGMVEPVRGRDAIAAFQDRVLKLIPDLRVRPLAVATNGQALFVHYGCEATVRGKPLAWEGFDRFELDGPLARRGTCIFDTAPLREAFAHHGAGISGEHADGAFE